MTVRVLLFGILADRAGGRELIRPIVPGATVATLLDALAADFPAFAAMSGKLATAVNLEYVGPSHALVDGDEVAIIPPVSGG
jgi:molybdopterin converting factor subunit 1